MKEIIDYGQEFKSIKIHTWIRIVGFAMMYLASVPVLYPVAMEIAAWESPLLETILSDGRYIWFSILTIPLLTIPFYMVNSHNSLRIRKDYLLQLQAEENGTGRERTFSDEAISKNAKRDEWLTYTVLGMLVAIMVAMGGEALFNMFDEGFFAHLSANPTALMAPAMAAVLTTLLYLFLQDFSEITEETLQCRESARG